MKKLKRVERWEDGDIAWDTDIPKLIDARCKKFIDSLLNTSAGEYDLVDVEFIVQYSIDMAFNVKRIKRRQEWVVNGRKNTVE